MKQQLANALGLMVEPIPHAIFGNFAVDQPEFVIVDLGVRSLERTMTIAEGFDFGSQENNAAFETIRQFVLVRRLPITGDHFDSVLPILLRHGKLPVPRFAILAHDHPFPHWDLFLENGPLLRSWRILKPLEHGRTVRAEAIGNHRLIYLDYEGTVSGDRGSVSRIDGGTFEWIEDQPRQVVIRIFGTIFVGQLILEAPQGDWSALLHDEVKSGK